MIKHIVLWKLKDRAAGADNAENAPIIKNRLEGLMGKSEGLRFIQVGPCVSGEAGGLCLYSELDDLDALGFYARHPLHLEVQQFVREVVCDRAACDFEAE